MSSPKDAAIATVAELKALAAEHGLFAVAQHAGYPNWVAEQRQQVLAAIKKTRSELRRLESALQRLEHAATSMGRDGSALKIEREYTPLEGWALTLVGNYARLLGFLRPYDREQFSQRLSQYTRGSILKAKGVNASHSLGKVHNSLTDQALMYKL